MFQKRTRSLSFLLILMSLTVLAITSGQASADNALVGKWGYTVLGRATDSWFTWKTEAGTITFDANGNASATYAESADTCPSADYCKASDTKPHTYTVNADGTFTFDGAFRIVVSDDGKTLIMDSTSLDNRQMLFVGVKMDPSRTYTNGDINGDYYTGAYEYDALATPSGGMGNNRVLSMIATMNGSDGTFTSNGTLNGDGTILTVNQPGTYSVGGDGSMTLNGALRGYAGTGGLAIFSNATGGLATDFASFLTLKKADKVYSTADLQGVWVMSGFGDRQKSVYRAEFGTITCGNAGNCMVSMKTSKSDGTTKITNMPLSMSLAADGSYNGFVFTSDMPHLSGAVGSNGNAMILIMNDDDQSTNDRALGVAVKCSTCAGLSPGVKNDFNSDGKPDILWRNTATGENAYWYMNGTTIAGSASILTLPGANWKIVGTGDFNSDGKPDILWRNTATGENAYWYMNGTTIAGSASILTLPDQNWTIVGTGDFNSDGKPDILWRNTTTGENAYWYMNGTTIAGSASILTLPDLNWKIVGTGDFNSDGKTDILWRNTATGENAYWYMNGTTLLTGASLLTVADLNWTIVGTGDFNSDGKTDILWRNTATGQNAIWYMNGTTIAGSASILTLPDANWKMVGG